MTIAASTYMITYSHQLYAVFEPMLGVFERRGAPREPSAEESEQGPLFDVLVFGLGRYGTALALRLRDRGLRVLGIDVSPQAIRRWRRFGLDTEHGDAADPEFVAGLPLHRAEWLVVTIPVHPRGLTHEDARTTLIQLSRSAGFSGRMAAAFPEPSRDGGALRLRRRPGAGAVLGCGRARGGDDRRAGAACGGRAGPTVAAGAGTVAGVRAHDRCSAVSSAAKRFPHAPRRVQRQAL